MKMFYKISILMLCCFALQSQKADAACPAIISRASWGARAPTSVTTMSTPVPFVVIHHGASAACTTLSSCTSIVKSFQNLHMDTNGWNDIGYSFIVGEDGNIYEGRGWNRVGAHAPNYNSNSIGICVIGNFETRLPNNLALTAVKQLIQCGIERGLVRAAYTLKGHRDVTSTACPGQKFYNEIRNWPRYG